MNMNLAENIRSLRRERSLTQEQLAEVLGVTVGAVHKWETRLSVPELPLIVEMADFFDTSVDALLGYEMKDNRLEATEARIRQYHSNKDRNGLAEVEKALKKYPHAFGIAHAGALLYHGIGLEAQDHAQLRRALALYEKARELLPQNRDASISEQTLCGSIAEVYFALGEKEKAVELVKQQNAGNLYSTMIGVVLAAEMHRPDEALPYLSRGLKLTYNGILYATMGYANVYYARRDWENGQSILQWGIRSLRGLKATDRPDFIDKLCAVYLGWLAGFQIQAGRSDAARDSLREAAALARAFDAAPDYTSRNMRFIEAAERDIGAYDTLGATAMEALENSIRSLENNKLTCLWKELTDHDA